MATQIVLRILIDRLPNELSHVELPQEPLKGVADFVVSIRDLSLHLPY